MKQLILLFCILGLAFSCGVLKPEEGNGGVITISGALGVGSSKISNKRDEVSAQAGLDLSPLKMYCVAFSAEATSGTSEFGTGGAFSVELPVDTPFGCFVVKKSDSAIVATLQVKDTNSGMSDESSSSMALKKDVSFGSITITEGNPVVEVPKAIIDSASSNVEAAIEVGDVHDTSWEMTCVDSTDTSCASFVSDSPKIYIRILKARRGPEDVFGIGVWSSASAFTTCGAQDMTTGEKSSIATEEGSSFVWLQNTATATTFSNATSDSSACPLRDSGDSNTEWGSIQNYYAMNKLVIQGNMFTLNQEDEETNGNCFRYNKTSVTFNPTNRAEMFGSFETAEVVTSGGDCDGYVKDERANFLVKFKRI